MAANLARYSKSLAEVAEIPPATALCMRKNTIMYLLISVLI